jgi:hypothetical protein
VPRQAKTEHQKARKQRREHQAGNPYLADVAPGQRKTLTLG